MFNVRSDLTASGITRLEHFDNADDDIIDDDVDSYSIISFSTTDGQEEQDRNVDRGRIDDGFVLPVYAERRAQQMADDDDDDDDDEDDDDDISDDDDDDGAGASPGRNLFIMDQTSKTMVAIEHWSSLIFATAGHCSRDSRKRRRWALRY